MRFGQENEKHKPLQEKRMIAKRVWTYFFTALIFGPCAAELLAQANSEASKTTPQAVAEERDGQHDFDFEFGHWKVHNRRLLHPLTGSNEWVDFDGTLVARPIWEGRANMDEFEADTPSGHQDGMTVRTYNPKSHQWYIYWTNSKSGSFGLPPTVGKFTNGRGEFYDQEEFNGKNIFVRFLWTMPEPDKPRWEQAFSVDGGKTWETNYIITYARVKE
jgi:hypothetical protein